MCEQPCTRNLCLLHTQIPRTFSTHLCSQIVACGQVLEPVQTVPVTGSPTAGVVVDHLGAHKSEVEKRDPGRPVGVKVPGSSLATGLQRGHGKEGTAILFSSILGVSDLHLPERIGAGGRGGRLAQRGPQEHLQLASILVAGQELLLLRME